MNLPWAGNSSSSRDSHWMGPPIMSALRWRLAPCAEESMMLAALWDAMRWRASDF